MEGLRSRMKCGLLVHCRFIPLCLMASFASSPISLLASQYVYQRYAEDAGLSPKNTSFQNNSVCIAEHNLTSDSVQDEVQRKASYFSMYMSIALIVPSAFCMPMWGALSDIVGRKVPIVFACIGNVARVVPIMCAVFFRWPLWIMLVGEAMHGVMGYHTGTVTYITSAYIADNCPSKSRTFEMVLVDFWLTLGMMTGSLLSGYLLRDIGYDNAILGYLVPLLVVCVFEVLLILYTIFFIPKFSPTRDQRHELSPYASQQPIAVFKSNLKRTFKKSYTVLFQSVNYRKELLIVSAIFCLVGAGGSGAREYLNVYTMGYPLCWRSVQLSVYQGVDLALHGITATVMTLLWQKKNWTQEWMILIGVVSAAAQYTVIGIAKETYIMFIAVCVGAFYILIFASARSIGATLVAPNDQGSLMAGLSNMDNIARLVAVISFNFIYSATMSIYEGMIFFLSAAIYLPCIPLVWKLYKLRSKHQESSPLTNSETL